MNSPNYYAKEYRVYERSIETLSALQDELGFLLVTYPLVEDASEAKKARGFFEEKEIDFLLIQNSGFSMGDVLMAFDGISIPIGLWAIEEPVDTGDIRLHSVVSLGMYASIARRCFTHNARAKWFFGQADTPLFHARFKTTVLALRARKRLKHSRVGLIGSIAPTFYNLMDDSSVYEQIYGTTIERLDHSVICDRISGLTEQQIEDARSKIRSSAGAVNISMGSLDNGAKTYAALRLIVQERGYDALAASCWPDFQASLGIVPCVPLTLLSDVDDVSVACEGDVGAAVSILTLREMSGKGAAVMDLTQISLEQDGLLMWHCGIGSKALAPDRDYVRIVNHPMMNRKPGSPDKIGLSYDYRFIDSPVVIARLSDNGRKLFCLSGTIDNRIGDGFAGTRGWVTRLHRGKMAVGVLDVINTIFLNGVEHHLVVAPGVFEAALDEFAYWCDIEKIDICPYRENI